jgi:hypothetical protein
MYLKPLLNPISYQSSKENIRVFACTVDLDTAAFSLDSSPPLFKLEIDSVSTFDSINKQTYISGRDNVVYQNGQLVKAFEIPMPIRQFDRDLIYYWRIKLYGGYNTGFEFWSNGAGPFTDAECADGWWVDQFAIVYREDTIIYGGAHSLKIYGNGTTDEGLTVSQDIANYAQYIGKDFTFSVWVKTVTPGRAYISIHDGTDAGTASAYHTGSGTWELLTVTRTISSNANCLAVKLVLNDPEGTGEKIAYYDDAIFTGVEYLASLFTPTQTFTIKKNITKETTDTIFETVADANVYPKEAKSTNVYQILKTYSKELDQINFENELTKDDRLIDKCRDEVFYENFGYLYGLKKAVTQTPTEYREQIRAIHKVFLNYSGTTYGLKQLVKIFTGEEPDVVNVALIPGLVVGDTYYSDPSYSLPPTLFLRTKDTSSKSYLQLFIFNSWNLVFNKVVMEDLVKRLLPAFTKVDFIYPNVVNSSFLFNSDYEWRGSQEHVNVESIYYGEEEKSELRLLAPNTSGYIVFNYSKLDCSSLVESYQKLEANYDLNDGALTFEYRSSQDYINWSDWEIVLAGQKPILTQPYRYVQVRATFTRPTGTSISPVLKELRINYRVRKS